MPLLWTRLCDWSTAAIISLTVGVLMFGCSTLTPHENFIAVHSGKIGRYVDDPDMIRSNFMNPRNLVFIAHLANGRKEMIFFYRRSCRYIYEVDENRRIVSWRYEGLERDCAIVP